MTGWKERGGTSGIPKGRLEERAEKGESRYLGERDGTVSELQEGASKMWAEKKSGPWTGSLKASWAARPVGFIESNRATKLRADLEILS